MSGSWQKRPQAARRQGGEDGPELPESFPRGPVHVAPAKKKPDSEPTKQPDTKPGEED